MGWEVTGVFLAVPYEAIIATLLSSHVIEAAAKTLNAVTLSVESVASCTVVGQLRARTRAGRCWRACAGRWFGARPAAAFANGVVRVAVGPIAAAHLIAEIAPRVGGVVAEVTAALMVFITCDMFLHNSIKAVVILNTVVWVSKISITGTLEFRLIWIWSRCRDAALSAANGPVSAVDVVFKVAVVVLLAPKLAIWTAKRLLNGTTPAVVVAFAVIRVAEVAIARAVEGVGVLRRRRLLDTVVVVLIADRAVAARDVAGVVAPDVLWVVELLLAGVVGFWAGQPVLMSCVAVIVFDAVVWICIISILGWAVKLGPDVRNGKSQGNQD